jgi:hypothetical protein
MNCLSDIKRCIDLQYSFVVGMSWCGYTARAIKARPSWPSFILDDHADAVKALDWLQREYKYAYVPFVFIEGEFQPAGSESLL